MAKRSAHKKKAEKAIEEVMNGPMIGAEVPLEVIQVGTEAKAIWDLKVAGNSVFEIANQTNKSPSEINEICNTCYIALKSDLTRMAEIGMMVDLERIDGLLKPWLKAASMPDWMVTMIIDGTPVDIRDADRALTALMGAIRLLELRAKLMNYQGVKEQSNEDEQVRRVLSFMVRQEARIRQLTAS